MKKRTAWLVLVLLLSGICRADNTHLDQYNVVWDTPSKDSSESMPCGGHSIGLNVWVEDGDILFYAQRSGSFSENNEYLKLGRFRLRLDPNPFKDGAEFRQELMLHDGYVVIAGKKGGVEATVSVWVEALRPVIHMDVDSNKKLDAVVSYESWREDDFELLLNKPGEKGYSRRFGCFGLECYPGTVIRYGDEIKQEGNGVLFYHRNSDDKLLIDYMIKQQGLEAVQDQLVNTQKGRTFGGKLVANNFVEAGTSTGKYQNAAFKAWNLKSEKPAKKHSVTVYTHVDQTERLDEWMEDLNELSNAKNPEPQVAKQQTLAWWHEFWRRSWLMINPEQADQKSEDWQVGRNYQLFRYQLGCNFMGEFPTKFNGGNFTFDPCLVLEKGEPNKKPFNLGPTPDWRSWGGGSFTAQNQRLVYWPLLKTGDFVGMTPQFDFYKRALPSAKARVKAYWGHEGCCFTEQMENFGLPCASTWGWPEPEATSRRRPPSTEPGVQVNGAVSLHYEAQLEFSYMILEYYRYSGADISEYIEFIKQSVRFFDEHYQMRHQQKTGKPLDKNGKLVIAPSTACESYKGAVNPIDACSGLKACLDSLVSLPDHYISTSEKEYFRSMISRVPEFSYGEAKGVKVYNPAHTWKGVGNGECPQFYPLFPFNRFELGKDDAEIEIFRNTWEHGTFPKKKVWSWHQDGIFFARMGLTEMAKQYNTKKLKDCGQRFPTFWGPGHDWVPDHNWGGSGMIGLQEMLMQTVGDKIRLFPAWPMEWDVDFKLHAPQQTIVEGKFRNGKVVELKVTPESRRADLVLNHGN